MEATMKYSDRKPLEARAESPNRADTERAYTEYVEGWKREEGAPEDVVRATTIADANIVDEGVEGKNIKVHLKGQDGGDGGDGDVDSLGSSPPLLPEIYEMTDWMLERSRR